jgi:hypothetical protein
MKTNIARAKLFNSISGNIVLRRAWVAAFAAMTTSE